MKIITLPTLKKFFDKLLNGDKKFTKISVTNLEANNLKADVSEFEDIKCKNINTQNNNINTGTGAITAGSAEITNQMKSGSVSTGAITCTTIVANAVDTKTNGLMSSSDKIKLDKYPINVGSEGQVLKTINSNGKMVLSWAKDEDTKYNNASQNADGLMSSYDKTKLDGIAEGATAFSLPTGGSKGQILKLGDDGKTLIWGNNTVYTHPDDAGNKHIPSGGNNNQFLMYSSNGTAQWAYVRIRTDQPSNPQPGDIWIS